VHVRDPGPSSDQPPREPLTEVTFRVPTPLIVIRFGVAAGVAVAALATGDRLSTIVGVLSGVAVGLLGLRDVLARDRLHADATGVDVVAGFARRRHLDWAEVEGLRVDDRLRLGMRSKLLEVDADAELHLFSRYDLGVEPSDALEDLLQVRGDR
jgi:hypothetical protein